MKRFLLFAFDAFYPAGGWSDFVRAFETREEADAHLAARVVDGRLTEPRGDSRGYLEWEHWQLVDLVDGGVVASG